MIRFQFTGCGREFVSRRNRLIEKFKREFGVEPEFNFRDNHFYAEIDPPNPEFPSFDPHRYEMGENPWYRWEEIEERRNALPGGYSDRVVVSRRRVYADGSMGSIVTQSAVVPHTQTHRP